MAKITFIIPAAAIATAVYYAIAPMAATLAETLASLPL
jgi:hypothetical protein